MKGGRRCTHSLWLADSQSSRGSQRPLRAQTRSGRKQSVRSGLARPLTTRQAPMPLIHPLWTRRTGRARECGQGLRAELRTPRSSACCFASHLHSKLWVGARSRPHPYSDPCGSSTHTPEALQFCHCPCRARLAPQVFFTHEHPHQHWLKKKTFPRIPDPTTRSSRRQYSNSLGSGRNQAGLGGGMGPHWDFENVKLSINLLSIQTPSILVLVGVPKLIIAWVGVRPWS